MFMSISRYARGRGLLVVAYYRAFSKEGLHFV